MEQAARQAAGRPMLGVGMVGYAFMGASRGVRSMTRFNYRRVPALAVARKLVADGGIGRIRHVRASYLQDWLVDASFPLTWRLQRERAGSGALGDLGRQRAAAELADTARAAAAFGVETVVGFTGSSIWHTVAMFPPVPAAMIDEGYADFARRWNPILDVFDAEGVRFALEVHPSEIAYDFWTTSRALEAVDYRPAFGLNFDPSHFVWQDLDPVAFLAEYRDRIYHVDCKEARKRLDGRSGRLGSHLPWGDPRRGWDFVSAGRGDIRWEDIFRMLNSIGYRGPISIEWEDAGMDRLAGAAEAITFLRRFDFDPPQASFDAAFTSGHD